MFSVPFSVLPSNRTNCFGDSPEGAMSIMASGLAYQHFRTVYRESFGSDLPHWVDKPHLFEKMPIVRMAARAGFRLFLAVLIEDELPDASVPRPPETPSNDLPTPQKRRLNMSADSVRIAHALDFASGDRQTVS